MSESTQSPTTSSAAAHLCTTDGLIDHYAATTHFSRSLLETVIPAAIDALYANRDAGGNMHSAGAAAIIAALEAARPSETDRLVATLVDKQMNDR